MSRSHIQSQTQLSLSAGRSRSPDSEIQSLGTVCRHTPSGYPSGGSAYSLLSISDGQESSLYVNRAKNSLATTTQTSIPIHERDGITLPPPTIPHPGQLARWKSEEGLRFRSQSGPSIYNHARRYPILPHSGSYEEPPFNGRASVPSSYSLALDGKRNQRPATPFKRWISALRKRSVRLRRSSVHSAYSSPQPSELKSAPWPEASSEQFCRASPSFTSSLGLLAAVKTASMTLASTSAIFSVFSSRHSVQNGSSVDKEDGSAASNISAHGLLRDPQGIRLVQRWRVLNELLISEEEYLSCLKALSNFFFTILANDPLVNQHKDLIHRIFFQLQDLHGEVMVTLDKELRPYSSRITDDIQQSKPNRSKSRIEFRLPENGVVTGVISRLFISLSSRFLSAYEGFASHLDFIQSLSASVSATNPEWKAYERGIEALSIPLSSLKNRDAMMQKSLTMSDLLVKPIQRICKYVVIFESLLAQLPACDNTESHNFLAHVVDRFRGILREINASRDHELTRELFCITWRIQERIVLPPQSEFPPTFVAALGKVLLCGVLFGSFEVNGTVDGRYFICILYRTHFILASAQSNRNKAPVYHIDAILDLQTCSLEDSGIVQGLRHNSCPWTWKLIVSVGSQNFELLFSADAEKEEVVWKSHLQHQIKVEKGGKWLIIQEDRPKDRLRSCIMLPVQPLNPSRQLFRRLSLYYPSPVSWFNKVGNRHVIIKTPRTSVVPDSPTPTAVCRSVSQTSRESVSILSPQQSERLSLEKQIADIWTKGVLPISSGTGKGVRSATALVIQKLSISNFASSLSKRATSYGAIGSSHALNVGKHQEKGSGCTVPLRLMTENGRPCSSLGILNPGYGSSSTQYPAPIESRDGEKIFDLGKRMFRGEGRLSNYSLVSRDGVDSQKPLRRSKSKLLKSYLPTSNDNPPLTGSLFPSRNTPQSSQAQLLRPSIGGLGSPKRHHSMYSFSGSSMTNTNGGITSLARPVFATTSKLRLVYAPPDPILGVLNPSSGVIDSDVLDLVPISRHDSSESGATIARSLSKSPTIENTGGPQDDTVNNQQQQPHGQKMMTFEPPPTHPDCAPLNVIAGSGSIPVSDTVPSSTARSITLSGDGSGSGTSANPNTGIPIAGDYTTTTTPATSITLATIASTVRKSKSRIRSVPAVIDALTPKKFRRRTSSKSSPHAKEKDKEKVGSPQSNVRRLSWLLR